MKVVLDAGHGLTTPGKRTPDGMKEYEFNRAVAGLVRILLETDKTAQVLFSHSNNRDVPLSERASLANSWGADLFVSIHANANGNGSWDDAHGIETFIFKTLPRQSVMLANSIHGRLIAATKLRDRGIKEANFHVLRATNCPAVLLECGFMTNRHEAGLLQSDSYRQICAAAIAGGILDYSERLHTFSSLK
ncbi:N-acetylmuramoyl-L-alanine amidase [Bacillus sp. M6-12]|uniref:N-acetylmuramoyl-L-alanine amidase family protein n=1 Tax=Bacillus sp. M6-12 TaxID=2054166 RepID=UPI000C785047|nr:N-acetylmuramoyl-L-alanine amidase [Bacillus sp. M6-12]PLS17934.1 N-acetylmuramoyl-L-alanine amidase [Bacillus sp. M6-12]